MKYSIVFLAAAAVVQASPMPKPQVTANISPSAAAPSGCTGDFPGTFGVAVQKVTTGGSQSVSQIPDGQPL